MEYRIHILDSENIVSHTVEGEHGKTLLDVLLKAKVPIDNKCGGHATCGTCRVFLISGSVMHGASHQCDVLMDRVLAENERLSCQSLLESDIVIKIP